MKFDFDQVINRQNTNSIKWDYNQAIFGREDVLPLWVGDMDFASPPEVVKAIQERAAHPVYGYPGTPAKFYDAAIDWVFRRYQFQLDRKRITFVPGVMTGIHLAVDAFTEPDDEIIIQPPVYHPFFHVGPNRGRKIVENPLVQLADGSYRVDLDDLQRKITKKTRMIILCNPHNPVGRVWSQQELLSIAQIATEHKLIVVSDEVHSDLVYANHTITPYYTLPEEWSKRSLTFFATSKSFNLPGLFTSLAVIPDPKLYQRYVDVVQKSSSNHINIFGIEATIAAYQKGEEWLTEVIRYIEDNARYLSDFLSKHIPEVKFHLPEATYFAWLDFREFHLTNQQLKDFMIQKAKLGLNDGFIFGRQGSGYQRLNIACPRSTLEKALNQLFKAYKEK
ncbi:cystathione beta-lyase [Seinonella peptonophila]|uniref:cysteine-S-conjugate beta-lyase n=1 Tax=Seinonella peptonophila TaxID=112248 RepID=A0A1M4TDH6_9BACL|nr:PatB family C-S lyase [Seinonella peptonophila]SHE42428.1 cystathione beta-lyase [Seinonella peptonophila]